MIFLYAGIAEPTPRACKTSVGDGGPRPIPAPVEPLQPHHGARALNARRGDGLTADGGVGRRVGNRPRPFDPDTGGGVPAEHPAVPADGV